jgi:hypothetical protein
MKIKIQYLKLAFLTALVALTVAACGGGGGCASSANCTTTTSTPTGSTTTPTTPTTPTAVAVATVGVSIVDASGAVVTSIAIGGGFKARAILRDAAGASIASKLVTFSLNGSSIANLTPAATALTNASGVAEVGIAPLSVNSAGAASLSASADIGVAAASISGKVDFAVTATNISLSALTAGQTNLPSGGATQISTTALIGGVPATGVVVNVVFSATCGKINGIDASTSGVSVTINGNGIASATYDAISGTGGLCSGAVTLSASSPGAAVKTLSLTVADPTADAIIFVSANPAKIFIAGSGAIEQSQVKFKVLSTAGIPLQNVGVKLGIVINPGGVGLNATGSTATVTATSNASGEVSVSVFSGTIPGPVKVRAELIANANVFSESQNLTVASGSPSQRFMSLSVEKFNIEGWLKDGSPTRLTVRIADRQGNAVEDGTVVNFTAEAGQVATSCATARINDISMCSVDFQSQNPRPTGGRVSVMAYLAGTKNYVDANANNIYDAGDTLINIGDAYRDDNENGAFDAGEFLIPRGGTLPCAGTTATFPSVPNTCDANLVTTVRQQAIILYSSSQPTFTTLINSVSKVSVTIGSFDNPLLPMPAGTTISAEASGLTCAIDKQFGSPVPNVDPTRSPDADLRTDFVVTLKTCFPGDTVYIKVTSPSGLQTIQPITLP